MCGYSSTCATAFLFVSVVVGCGPPDINQAGGTIYIYELARDRDGVPPQLDIATKEATVSVLEERLDPIGTRGIHVYFNEADRLEIAVPSHDESPRPQVQALATATGRLQFLVLANRRDHGQLIATAKTARSTEVKKDDTVLGRWVDVVKRKESGNHTLSIPGDIGVLRNGKSGELVIFSTEEIQGMGGGPHVQNHILREKGITDLQVLVVVEHNAELRFQSKHLASVSEAVDGMGEPCLEFVTTEEGAEILTNVTKANLPEQSAGFHRRLGIVLDDQLLSAPRIVSTIKDRGKITGDFTRQEIQRLARILQAGQLPVQLSKKPVKTISVDPSP
ncbi:MAG: SecDF P1 head subdomain-containing protein [Planctomycetota bacterium]